MPKIAEFSWEKLEYSKGGSGGTGGTGTPGRAATIKVGTVVSGATASVTNVGTSDDAVFNFVLPKGDTGGTGTKGRASTIKVGTVVSGNTASVTNVGTSDDAVFNFVLPKGADADTSVIKSLQSDVQAVQNTLKSVDKYSEYEERYVAFSPAELPANNAFKQINFQRTFSTIPFVQITLDIQDPTPRVAYYSNVTRTGFQIASNYGSAVKGVWYKAYVK